MPIPDFQTIMLPMLRVMADGQEHSIQGLLDRLAETFSLSEEELRELLPSGKQTLFYNRVGWARTYLAKAGLLETTRRSYYRITARGQQVLQQNPSRIDIRFLEQFPEYLEFRRRPKLTIFEEKEQTPEEVLEDAYQEIRNNLAQELLKLIKQSPPAFFERLVVELLVNMGYGGSRRDAARAVGQVGDEGIDGIIDEDRLGLDTIYIQAKRWDNVVGRPEIQKFVGALMGKRARKGIFITTSTFSAEAINYVANIDTKIVLIDGKRLAELMIDYDVGVATVSTYQLKRVDSDYFGNG
ncbi:MAG: restriction endonuclease [Chloroflexus sp.]|uniref:restriction endonuclease n=1 Tax=Chloroflexus sp. TaxID=1904827 RepID=UPI0030AFA98B